jgi:hypothetical protein
LLRLHHAALERAQILGWATWSVSLSHDREHAIAFVVAMSDPLAAPRAPLRVLSVPSSTPAT